MRTFTVLYIRDPTFSWVLVFLALVAIFSGLFRLITMTWVGLANSECGPSRSEGLWPRAPY